ncbi:MAG: dihydroneopterin aldolase [Bacteroidetes bacterium]|nr:dihydroneopterin aldolase [Bacteroidota bacterium]
MLSIQLKDIQFNSFHGLYTEEKFLGNNFIVNVCVKYLPKNDIIKLLDETINYENIFEIVQQKMLIPTELLETLVTEIAQKIMDTFQLIKEVEISIAKQNPPIEKFVGNVVVSYYKNRN